MCISLRHKNIHEYYTLIFAGTIKSESSHQISLREICQNQLHRRSAVKIKERNEYQRIPG